MRKSRFTEAQIIGMIKEQEAGRPTAEVCAESRQTTPIARQQNACRGATDA